MEVQLYKIRFNRECFAVHPSIKQESDVVFRSDENPFSDDFLEAMWEEAWSQNPHWLLSHGPRTVGSRGWSSVMWDRDTLEKVERAENNKPPEDLTGDGNSMVNMTYHPLLPNDLRVSLKRAYDRGKASCEKL